MKWATTILAFAVAALIALGMVELYSSNMGRQGGEWLMRQVTWMVLGLISAGVAISIDYGHLRKFAWVIFGLAVVLLAAVLIPHLGSEINGARRWFSLRVGSFQPSELGKIALIVMLAWYGERYQRLMKTFWRGIVVPGCIASVIMGLVFLEPDYGTTGFMALVAASLLFIAGAQLRFMLPPMLAGVSAFCVAVYFNPVRLQRVLAFLHPEEHKMGTGFQAYQAMIALGAGGTTGLGLGNGRQKLGFVPEQHTDFILSVIGEELGLVATIGVVLGFMIVVLCGVYIASRARDTFGRLLAAGVTFMIGMQAIINIGVATSALPNKGLPLPFISHGGSNLLFMLIGVGLLINVARHANDPRPVLAGSEMPPPAHM